MKEKRPYKNVVRRNRKRKRKRKKTRRRKPKNFPKNQKHHKRKTKQQLKEALLTYQMLLMMRRRILTERRGLIHRNKTRIIMRKIRFLKMLIFLMNPSLSSMTLKKQVIMPNLFRNPRIYWLTRRSIMKSRKKRKKMIIITVIISLRLLLLI